MHFCPLIAAPAGIQMAGIAIAAVVAGSPLSRRRAERD